MQEVFFLLNDPIEKMRSFLTRPLKLVDFVADHLTLGDITIIEYAIYQSKHVHLRELCDTIRFDALFRGTLWLAVELYDSEPTEEREATLRVLLERMPEQCLDLESRDKHGNTVLLNACQKQYPVSLINLFLLRGANVMTYGRDGFTPLLHCVEKMPFGSLQLFCEAVVESHSSKIHGDYTIFVDRFFSQPRNNVGKPNALYIAAQHGCADKVEYLLKWIDPHVCTLDIRNTPLIAAAGRLGKSTEFCNPDGDRGFYETVKLLIPRSNLFFENVDGVTALSAARENKADVMTDLLFDSMAMQIKALTMTETASLLEHHMDSVATWFPFVDPSMMFLKQMVSEFGFSSVLSKDCMIHVLCEFLYVKQSAHATKRNREYLRRVAFQKSKEIAPDCFDLVENDVLLHGLV
jgi:hypothetical protein